MHCLFKTVADPKDRERKMKINRLSFLSVLTVLCATSYVADAAIRIGNSGSSNDSTARMNRAGAYQQAQTQLQQITQPVVVEEPVVTIESLPIPVANQQLAQSIINGDPGAPSIEMLQKCSMLIPGAEFEWAKPTIGMSAGGKPTCVAVIELRDLNKPDTTANTQHTVLARAKLAVGESIKCNASDFPDSAYMPNLGEIVVPADSEPTIEEVTAVMNEEQKQNAGLKIIGAALIGGLGGNFVGKNEPGKDSMLGGGKDKIKSTLLGAAGSAALAAGSTFGGKVAGDMIMSAGVNAAAGAAIGNTVSGNSDVLRIDRCTINGDEQKCLYGYFEEEGSFPSGFKNDDNNIYLVNRNNISQFLICKTPSKDPNKEYDCALVKLQSHTVNFKGYENLTTNSHAYTLEDVFRDSFSRVNNDGFYCYSNGGIENSDSYGADCEQAYVKISDTPKIAGKRTPAMIPLPSGFDDKLFGYKLQKWDETNGLKTKFDNQKIYKRNNTATATSGDCFKENEECITKIDRFRPMAVDADDGATIDIGNKARMGGTLAGAGVGAGMGAFTAYQGAKTEIEERWAVAVQEYKDSLQKFYCGSGNKFMSFYNDIAVAPALK